MTDDGILKLLPKSQRPFTFRQLELAVRRIERLKPIQEIGKLTVVLNDFMPQGICALVQNGRVVDIARIQDHRKHPIPENS